MGVVLKEGDLLPEYPEFEQEAFDRASATGDAMPLLFEWYKWTGLVTSQVACLQGDFVALQPFSERELAILRGLLNRCSRLMIAILRLASTHKHAEAVRLLNRSVCESAIVVQWLCTSGTGEPFRQYIAKGLDAELRLKQEIERQIEARGGSILVIEKRMLAAIAELCSLGGLTADEVRATKKFPSLESMLRTLGHDELSYVVVQRLGSHAVHGTWPDLLSHYLAIEDGEFVLTDNTLRTEGTELVGSATLVLEAVSIFAKAVLKATGLAEDLAQAVNDGLAEIVRIHRLTSGDDYSAA